MKMQNLGDLSSSLGWKIERDIKISSPEPVSMREGWIYCCMKVAEIIVAFLSTKSIAHDSAV